MRPELVPYLLVALAAPIVLIMLLVLAIVQRYRDRPTPSWMKWSAALLAGFALSPAFIIFVTEPLWLVLLILPGLWLGWSMARSGRIRTAGLAALGMTLPATLWWGRFLLEDALRPASLYDPVLVLWWLPPAVGVVLSAGLIVIGDHPDPVPRVMKRPRNTARDPMALGNAMSAKVALGITTLPSIVAEGSALLVAAPAAVIATAFGLPWPLVIVGTALLYMVIATELWYVAFPRRQRLAWGAFSFVGHIEMERFRAVTGTDPPNSERKIHQWLRANEERRETRWVHAELLAVVGRIDEARAMAERIGPATPAERYERDSMLDYINWIDGREIDFDARFRAADTIGAPGSQERLFARGQAALALARDRAELGADWAAPLEELAREIGSVGWAYWRQDTRRRRMMATFLLGLLVGALFSLPALPFVV